MKLLITTRNRPDSLSRVLSFLENFYPGTSVIVADGSLEEYKTSVAVCTEKYRGINVEFKSYDYSVSIFDRILDVLENESEEYIAMGADDDFPMIDVLQRGEIFLRDNPDYGVAIGTLLLFDMDAEGKMTANISPVRPITHDLADWRVRQFAAWTFPLSYSLCRKDVLINRYQSTQDCDIGEMYDLVGGLYDCMMGKVYGIPGVSLVLTRNSNHSYLRVGSNLDFLENGPKIVSMVHKFKLRIMQCSSLDNDTALRLATNLYTRRVGTYLSGIPTHHQQQFIDLNLHKLEIIRSQYANFENLFKAGTEQHERHRERLAFVSNALRENSYTNENSNVPLQENQKSAP